jgi:hypothetical protein
MVSVADRPQNGEIGRTGFAVPAAEGSYHWDLGRFVKPGPALAGPAVNRSGICREGGNALPFFYSAAAPTC